jgi:hypothetical protein
MKRFLGFMLLLIVLSMFLVAFRPMQAAEPTTPGWRDVFKMLIFLVTAALGAPITQVIKNALGAEGRWALVITAVVSGVLAVLELFLSKTLNFSSLTVETLPGAALMIFGVATVYYQWFKNSPSFFGQGGLLKPPAPKV